MGDNTVAWVLLIIGLVALIWFVNWIGHRAGDKVQDAIEHKINKSKNEKTAGGWQSLAEKYGYNVDGISEATAGMSAQVSAIALPNDNAMKPATEPVTKPEPTQESMAKSERAPVQQSPQMMNQGNMKPRFCGKCGTKLEGVENFCGKCGAKIDRA